MTDSKSLMRRLCHERELLRKLLALSVEQRDCLVAGQAERLSEIVGQQTSLLQRLSRSSVKTLTALSEMDEVRLEFSPEEAAEWRRLREEVKELAENLRRQGRLNWMLAAEAMRYIDFSINLLSGRTEEPAYASSGRRESRSAPLLVNKTA